MTGVRLELVSPAKPELDGHIVWDVDTGEISGTLADLVGRLAASAAAAGEIHAPPHPTVYSISRSPLRSRRDMALLCSMFWEVPEELVDALPERPDDSDEIDGVLY